MGLRDFILRVKAETSGAQKGFKDLDKAVSGTTATLSKANLAIGAIGLGVAGFTATLASLERGGSIVNVERGFDSLQKKVGLFTENQLVNLRAETKGLISDFDLMKEASQAAQLGLNPAQLDEMAGAALKLGKSLGRDAVSAFQDLVAGVGRGSRLILDNLGIIVKQSEATARGLTFQELAIQKIIEKAEQLPDVNLNAAESYIVLQASMRNANDQFAKGAAESEFLAMAFKSMNDQLKEFDFEGFGRALGNATAVVVAMGNAVLFVVDGYAQLWDLLGPGGDRILEKFEASLNKVNAELLEGATSVAKVSELQEEFNDKIHNSERTIASLETRLEKKKKQLDSTGATLGRFDITTVLAQGHVEELNADVIKLTEQLEREKVILETSARAAELAGNKIKFLGDNAGDSTKALKALETQLKKVADFDERLLEQTLAADFRNALQSLDESALTSLMDKIGNAVFDSTLRGLQDAIKTGAITQDEAEDRAQAARLLKIRQLVEEEQKERDKRFEESVDFFDKLLHEVWADGGSLADIIERTLKNAAIRGLAETLASATGFTSIFGSQNSVAGGIFGIPGVSSAISSSIGLPSLAGAGGSLVGGLSQTIGSQVFLGGAAGPLTATQSLLAGGLATGGIAALGFGALALGDSLFGGSASREEIERGVFRDEVRELLGGNLTFQGVGGATSFPEGGTHHLNFNNSPVFDDALARTIGLGTSFGDSDRLGQEAAVIFANAVAEAENLTEVQLNVISLFQQMGKTAQEIKNDITNAFLAGEISLEQFNEGFDSVNLVSGETIANIDDAMRVLAENIEDSPQIALLGLGKILEKLESQGIDTAEELRARFVDKFGPDVAEAFVLLNEKGIDSFTELSELTADEINFLANLFSGLSDDIINVLGNSIRQASEEGQSNMQGLRNEVQGLANDYDNLTNRANRFRNAANSAQAAEANLQNTVNQNNLASGDGV